MELSKVLKVLLERMATLTKGKNIHTKTDTKPTEKCFITPYLTNNDSWNSFKTNCTKQQCIELHTEDTLQLFSACLWSQCKSDAVNLLVFGSKREQKKGKEIDSVLQPLGREATLATRCTVQHKKVTGVVWDQLETLRSSDGSSTACRSSNEEPGTLSTLCRLL